MHVDAHTLDDGTLIEADLCIVGAGAAGIATALEWIDTPYQVALLEGGGFRYEAEVQDLYRGEIVGESYFPLEAARLHFFGGTTNHWAGWCAPFDAIDFEPRAWVPHSGWPIRLADLEPYYARAQPLVECGPHPYDASYWEASDPERVRLPFDESMVWTKMWQFSPPTRFGERYRDAVVGARNVHLYTHANVCDIRANEAVSRVDELEVRCLNGKRHRVRARAVVLACGAMQNARLLLASNGQAPAGLGNDHDLVGRYFMEHFEVHSGHLALFEPPPMKLYLMKMLETPARGELALTAAAQEAHRVLNVTASLSPGVGPEALTSSFERFAAPESMMRNWERMERGERIFESGPPVQTSIFQLFTRAEQAPNPESRVLLSSDRDALGMPRVRLNWQVTDLDKRSIRTTYEVFAREAGRRGIGRVRLREWLLTDDPPWPSFLGGGWHHMGTTRMHDDPRRGVVDRDCKVHGLANLYVAGSGAFPTAGAANPTLTLLALTLRLSDHLKRRLA